MSNLLDDPMVQAGVAPFLAALVVALALSWSRLAWLAVVAGLATAIALSTGISFTPLSASRKIVLLVLLSPLLGLALERVEHPPRWLSPLLAVAAGLAALWVFQSVLQQQETAQALTMGGGVALFVALLVGLTLRLREDGVAAGSAALGLGVAVGVAAILSASLGNMMNGIALAVSAAALLLVQLLRGRAVPAGWAGTLSAGLAAALFAAATFVLAELRWMALVLLLLVPLAAGLAPFGGRALRLRIVLQGLFSLLVATATILAAWLATRSS